MTDFKAADRAARDKERWERTWESWWKTDRVDAVAWGLGFLWGALVIVGDGTSFRDDISWWEPWGVFLVGAGVIVLLSTVFRVLTPEYRLKWGWALFWGTVFLSQGLGALAHPAWRALPLAALAGVILTSALGRTDR